MLVEHNEALSMSTKPALVKCHICLLSSKVSIIFVLLPMWHFTTFTTWVAGQNTIDSLTDKWLYSCETCINNM